MKKTESGRIFTGSLKVYMPIFIRKAVVRLSSDARFTLHL